MASSSVKTSRSGNQLIVAWGWADTWVHTIYPFVLGFFILLALVFIGRAIEMWTSDRSGAYALLLFLFVFSCVFYFEAVVLYSSVRLTLDDKSLRVTYQPLPWIPSSVKIEHVKYLAATTETIRMRRRSNRTVHAIDAVLEGGQIRLVRRVDSPEKAAGIAKSVNQFLDRHLEKKPGVTKISHI